MRRLTKLIGLTLVLLIEAMLTACSTPTPATPFPTPLPTAVPPGGAPGSWAIGFAQEFAPEFWQEGLHRYSFYMHCPALIGDFATDWYAFEVSEEAQLLPEEVFLRLGGLTTERLASVEDRETITAIHPSQPTTAVIYLTGLSEASVELSTGECGTLMAWDDESPQALTPIEPFEP